MNQLRASLAVGGAVLLAVFYSPLSAPPAYAQDAKPPPGQALLYIFRSDREPREALIPVAVNAELASYLENDTFIAVTVLPGKTFLRSGERVLGTLEFEAAADHTYYVRVEAVHGINIVQTDINLVSEADGRAAVAQSRFVPVAPPPPRPQAAAAGISQPTAAPPSEPAAEPESSADSSAYFRVDVGYSQSTGVDIKDNNFANSGIICGDSLCTTAGKLKDVGGGPVAIGGVGYRFGPHGRGDLTAGFRSYKLNATDAIGNTFKATVSSVSVMANAYFDFARAGTSPYVGLGIGFAQNKVGMVTVSNAVGSGTIIGGTKAGVAGAFMAGVGIALSGGTVLDIGYRFASLGKLSFDADPTIGYDGASGKLNAHELTVGLRF